MEPPSVVGPQRRHRKNGTHDPHGNRHLARLVRAGDVRRPPDPVWVVPFRQTAPFGAASVRYGVYRLQAMLMDFERRGTRIINPTLRWIGCFVVVPSERYS
jgi:hypothetical protein